MDTINCDALRRVLARHPVRLAVLFGSHVRGEGTESSDIDIAVEFEDSVSKEVYGSVRLGLIADLMSAAKQEAIDVADLDDMRPDVGREALDHGIVLVGDIERAERYREDFERRAAPPEKTRRERFDALLERLEGVS